MEHDDGLVRSGAQVDDGALSLGAVAVLFVFVPVVGDFVAVPATLAAVSLELVGFLSVPDLSSAHVREWLAESAGGEVWGGTSEASGASR
ncbi:hypothetical protein ACQE98_12775 [Ornithinimicrobium sp. W1679]|uniref:hypothetical protein n=1 Tax=Ornithinimicrobium sp. W1679 TaxID=3418770 RepID=UPI003CE853FC